MTSLSEIRILAFPNGKAVNIGPDSLEGSKLRMFWGIRGVTDTDILADIGDARFTLNNYDKIYYPDGSSGISGWGNNVPVQVIFIDENGVRYIRFKGYLDIDSIRVGQSAANNRVSATILDWMTYATKTPIKSPDIAESKTIDEALTTLLALSPFQPESTSFETGDYTFPTVFDNLDVKTKLYNEFAKLAYSESPGHIYLTKDRTSGETLVSENSTHRVSTEPVSSTTALTPDYYLRVATGNYLRIAGGAYKKLSVTEGTKTDIEISETNTDAIEIDYGKNIINYATATAWPRRIDDEPQVLYALDYPMAIAAGETITFRAPYVDQMSGRPIGAIVSSMLAPEAPGDPDTYRKLLCHFTTDTTDSTGNHTVTANDVTIENDVYVDVGPEPDVQRLNSGIIGPYALFGGYANYNLSVASSSDFEFGSGAFTIGFYAAILDPTSGDGIMARDGTTSFAPWVIGKSDGSNLLLYASSNGSSWDIANGVSMGAICRNRWVHYEWGRDDNGFFHLFVNGKYVVDPWYSSASFVANSNALSIGKIQGANYMFMGFDELYIDKGRCLHNKEFEPPEYQLSELLDGDYWLNTAIDKTGTDNSSDLSVTAVYNSNSVYYTIKNNNASAGFFYVQARGRGVYPYNPIEDIREDAPSQNLNGFQEIRIQQRYQQNLAAGTDWITDIISREKAARTRLKSVSFYANRNSTTMERALQADVGNKIRAKFSDPGIDGYYHIQSVSKDVKNRHSQYITWGLKEAKALSFTFLNNGSWSSSASGAVMDNPTLGVELFTDSGFDTGVGWSYGGGWAHNVDKATHTPGSLGALYQTDAFPANSWVRMDWDTVVRASRLYPYFGSANYNEARLATGSYVDTKRAKTGTCGFYTYATSFDGDVDNVIAKVIPLTDLINVIQYTGQDVKMLAYWDSQYAGTQYGTVWLDDYTDPQNGIFVYCDGYKAYIDKLVSGTWTQVLAPVTITPGTYLAADIYLDGGAIKVQFYNESVAVGSLQSISDASIVAITTPQIGLFSTYEGNICSKFKVANTSDQTLWIHYFS